jgi:uncharacterized protein
MFSPLSTKRFGVQLLALLALIFIGLFLVAIATAIVLFFSTSKFSLDALSGLDFTNPSNIRLLKKIIPIQTVLLFGLPALLFGFWAHTKGLFYLGFRRIGKPMHIVFAIVAMLAGLYFVGLLAQVNKAIPMPQSWINTETDYAVLTKSLLTMYSISDLIFNLLIIALLPAVCEELLFRSCIQNILIHQFSNKYYWIAIVITGIIFGIIHGQMQTVLPRIFMGIVLGFIYYYSNNIGVSILAHFVNNGLQVVLAYLVSMHKVSAELMNDDAIVPTGYGLASGAVCILFIYFIYQTKQKYTLFTALPNSIS